MLYLVSTPIGNLADITQRALDTLRQVDLILCEDTRHSAGLMMHFGIQTPLHSYHKFNEAAAEEQWIDQLKAGKTIALISDAGTPAIADPGERLVKRAIAEGITVSPIPGASAVLAALVVSGLATTPFQFIGFLPKKDKERLDLLQEILHYAGTTICYESPHRILDLLREMQQVAPNRPLVVAREITKRHEEITRGCAQEILAIWGDREIRGELVLLIAGIDPSQNDEEWLKWSPEEHVAFLQQQFKMDKNEAIKVAAKQRGLSKRDLYRTLQND